MSRRAGAPTFCGGFARRGVAEGGRPERAPLHVAEGLRGDCRGGRAPRTAAPTFCGKRLRRGCAESGRPERAPLHFAGRDCGADCRRGRAPRTGVPTFCGGFAGRIVAEGGRPERAPLHFAEELRGGLSPRAGAPNGCPYILREGIARRLSPRAGAPNGRPYILRRGLRGGLARRAGGPTFCGCGVERKASVLRLCNKKSSLWGCFLRRERDSNPRRCYPQRFSRPPQSTTLPSLQMTIVFWFCDAKLGII